MSRTARLWRGAGLAMLLGTLLSGALARGGSMPEDLTRQLIDLADQAERQGQRDEAVRFLQKAVEVSPGGPDADARLRLAALRQDEFLPDDDFGRGGGGIERARQLEQVYIQRLTADINGRIGRARSLLRQGQAQAAETTLRLALTALESADRVPSNVADGLRRQVRVELLTTIRRSEELAQREAELIRLESASQREAAALDALLQTQQDVRELMIQFNTLMSEGVFNVLARQGTGNIVENSQPFFDARLLAQSATALIPNAPAPRAATIVSTALGFLSQTRSYEQLKEFRYMATLLDVDRASVPFPDTITIDYPPADVFRALSEKRISRYEAVDLVERSPQTLQIQQKLNQPIQMPFENDTPLGDALEYIKTATADQDMVDGIPIYVDPIGLQEAEETLQSPITMNLSGVPLKSTLRLMLKQLDLTYTVKDGLVTITFEDATDTPTEIRVYPVADLSIIPLSLMGMGGGGGGMGGGMGGMGGGGMGGMGGGGMGGMGGGGMGGMGGGGMGGGGFRSVPIAPPVVDDPSAGFSQKKSN